MAQLKIILVIFWTVACCCCVKATSKYTDENRPYEFGFTIDGEQHRHEKKDENGIIMGEFGFITADGVYHVTVYATDENGNFKILSMKNIRVKPYPTAPNIGAKQENSLFLPSSDQNPKTSIATDNQAQLKARPAKTCSSCSVPTTTTQSPKVINPAGNNREQQEFTRNRQGYNAQLPNGYQNTQNTNEHPSVELNTPFTNNNQETIGLNLQNQQPYLNLNNNNYQHNSDLNKLNTQVSSLSEHNNPQNSVTKNQITNPSPKVFNSPTYNNYEKPEFSKNDEKVNAEIPDVYQNTQNVNSKQPPFELNTRLSNIPVNTILKNNQEYSGLNVQNQKPNINLNNNNYRDNSDFHNLYNKVSSLNEHYNPQNSVAQNKNPNLEHQNNPQNIALNSHNAPISGENQINTQSNGNLRNNAHTFDNRKFGEPSLDSKTDQTYPETSYQDQKKDTAKSIEEFNKNSNTDKFEPYYNNEKLNHEREKGSSGNNLSENRHPKSFNDILESVNPELHYSQNERLNGGLPEKPVLVVAQMQIVDKRTDVYHKIPGERDGLPNGLNNDDMKQLLYTFNYTLGFHGHHEEGYTNGAKYGYYFVTGRNGVRTRVDYVADETGFHPKISQEMLDILSEEVPKPETEMDVKYGLKGYEFKWLYYPVESP